MFQYQKEVIINSQTVNSDAYGSGMTTDRIVATNGLLKILRSGEYKFEGVIDGRIYKTPGVEGAIGNVALTFAPLANLGIYRVSIYIGMNNKFLADFAYANWYKFGKPIIVEVEVDATNNTGAGIAALVAEAIKDAVPYNNVFARPVVAGSTVTVYLTDPYAHIKGATMEFYDPQAGCDSCIGDYVPVNIAPVITANVEPFGTAAWIQENLRFPTLENLRYNNMYKDEYPVPGVTYTEYSFAYITKRDIGGVSVVGQANQTITRHVYFVANSLVDWFEKKVEEAFGDNVIVANYSTMILSAPTVANDGAPVQLVADVYPADSSVTVTFASANLPTDVTLTADGVLTALATATVGATFEITATPDNAAYTPVTRTFTVIAG